MKRRSGMKWRCLPWAIAVGAVVAFSSAAHADGFVKLSKFGSTVLTPCNPGSLPYNTNCKVTNLPGETGYKLVASRSAPVIINDVTVGTLFEKVWRNSDDSTLYIFGSRIQLNAAQWDLSGAAFNANDLSRRTLPGRKVSVAYYSDGATKALLKAGRTAQGLNEYEGSQPERDNNWLDFRIDANAAEPSGPSSAKSPWLLMKTRAPTGYALNQFGIRTLNSDFTDLTQAVDIYSAGYQPNGVPTGGGDDDDD